nr:hypothetical protein [Streptomyces sp. XY58]
MPGPLRVRRALGAGVDGDGAGTGLLGAERDLEVDPAVLGDDQRRLQNQLLQPVVAEAVARRERHLDQRGAGQQHGSRDRVVDDPRVAAARDAAREQQPLAVREAGHRTEQRVLRRREAQARHVLGRGRAVEPVPDALEGVRRQRDPPRTREEVLGVQRRTP